MVASSAGVAFQNWSGVQPRTAETAPDNLCVDDEKSLCPGEGRGPSRDRSSAEPAGDVSPPSRGHASRTAARQYLFQQDLQRWRYPGEAQFHHSLAQLITGQMLRPVARNMPEQRNNFRQQKPPAGRPFDQIEQRPQFLLGGYQSGETGPQNQARAVNDNLCLAAQGICRPVRHWRPPRSFRGSMCNCARHYNRRYSPAGRRENRPASARRPRS